jgi:Protein of unknown function (DUF3467)
VSDDLQDGKEDGELEGRYANYFQVGHNAFEFVLEFGQLYRGGDAPSLHTRIIANPAYVKEFLQVLGNALNAYQHTFGELDDPDDLDGVARRNRP